MAGGSSRVADEIGEHKSIPALPEDKSAERLQKGGFQCLAFQGRGREAFGDAAGSISNREPQVLCQFPGRGENQAGSEHEGDLQDDLYSWRRPVENIVDGKEKLLGALKTAFFQSQIQHNDKSKEKIPDIRWKNNLHKYDIVTNKDKNPEQLNKVSGYEYWQAHLNKKKTSNNRSDLSNRLQRMDLLNGRPMRSHKNL